MSDTTIQQLLPAKKERTTKIEKVVVERRTLTVQSRTLGFAAFGLFVAGFALGQWNPPVEPIANAAEITPSASSVVPTSLVANSGK